jgi:integrase/recombinase XerD
LEWLAYQGYVTNYATILMRARAATSALSNEADFSKMQEWLGHANVSTTRLNDRRKTLPEDSPIFYMKY